MDILKGVLIEIKSITRNKLTLFWNTIFPIFLLTIMIITFKNIGNNFEPIKIGIKSDNPYYIYTKEIKFLDIKEPSEDILKDLQDEKYIAFVDENLDMEITRNGPDITTAKNIFDNIKQIAHTNLDRQQIIKNFNRSFTEFSAQKNDKFNIFIYAVLIMTSLYTAFSTIETTSNILLDHSYVSIRILTAPLKKYKYILSSIISTVIVSLFNISILILYLKFVLKIDAINNYPLTYFILILTMVFGAIIGIFITVYLKQNSKTKNSIVLGLIMLMSQTAGLSGVNMSSLIEKKLPILVKINPASYLNNALVAINQINDFSIVRNGIIYITILSFVLMVLSILKLRRIKNVF